MRDRLIFFDKRNRIFRNRIFADLTVYIGDRATEVERAHLYGSFSVNAKLAVPCVNSCVSGDTETFEGWSRREQLLRRTFTLERTWTISRRRRWIVPKHCRQVRSNLSPALIRSREIRLYARVERPVWQFARTITTNVTACEDESIRGGRRLDDDANKARPPLFSSTFYNYRCLRASATWILSTRALITPHYTLCTLCRGGVRMKNTPLFILNTREKSRRACCSDVSQENGRIFLQANRAGKGVDDSCSFKRLFKQQNFIAQPYFIRSNSIVFFKSEPRVTDAIYKIKDCSKRRTPLLSQRTKTPYQNCHVKLE